MKKAVALLLALVMVFALCACGKSEEVISVENQIQSLENLGMEECAAELPNIKAAYNRLSDDDKKLVENYETLVKIDDDVYDFYINQAVDLLNNEMAACDHIIDLYSRIADCASSIKEKIGYNIWNGASDYYNAIIEYGSGEKTIESEARLANAIGSLYKEMSNIEIFCVASVVMPEKYYFDYFYYKYSHSTAQSMIEDGFVEEEDYETIIARCQTCYTLISSTPEINELTYNLIKDVKALYPEKENAIYALYDWYLAVNTMEDYTLNPSGALSAVVSDYSSVKTTVEQAMKTFDIAK